MSMLSETAFEEMRRDRRNAAHDVTMAVAGSLPIDRGYLFQCRWCRRSWLLSDDGARLEPKNHPKTCTWRIARAYADDVSGR